MLILVLIALVIGALMYLLSVLLFSLILSLIATIEFRDEYKLAQNALRKGEAFKGKHFSCVQTGLDLRANKGMLTTCKPTFTIKYNQYYKLLGTWWRLY